MVYAVIDTNVFVSAYMTHNLKSATSKVVQLSRPHLRINPVERDTLLAHIRKNGVYTNRTSFGELLIDEDDRVFYEVALSEEDSFLVTGNLKHFPIDPRVVTPAQMLQILGEE